MTGDSNVTTNRQVSVAWSVLGMMVFLKFAIHAATSFQYGFFRDEFYYIQWAERLDWGYVEQPPLTAVAILIWRTLFGNSLVALRLLPALLGAILVLVAGLIAREMGGKRFAQGMAALAVLVGPIFLGNSALMTVDPLNLLLWAACLLVITRLCRTGDRRLWLWFGVLAGLGLQNKLTFLFYGFTLLLAVLATKRRSDLAHKEFWIGGAIAAAIFSPYIVWSATHDWAPVEFMLNYGSGSKTYQASFFEWLYMQVLTTNPLTLPLWLAGIWFCLRREQGRPYAVVAWVFLIQYALFFGLKAKFYFLSPAFLPLFAAGSVAFEGWRENRRTWLKPAYIAVLVISGCVIAPMAMPVLPPALLVRYAALTGGNAGIRHEQITETALAQHFADQFGWEDMVRRIADIYHALPEEDQARCAIFANNYGEASAVDFYAEKYDLPGAISGHNNYYLWGPGDATGEVVIAIAHESAEAEFAKIFDSVEVAGRNSCDPCLPFESNVVFLLCRGLKAPLDGLWPSVKEYG